MAHILIIDDDIELFGLLNAYLVEEGFTCVHAGTPEKGLREAATCEYAAVVLDVMLPGINGFEVLRRIRADGPTRHLPVLMLTPRGEEIDRVVGLEMGADDYLPKPFSSRELVARLRALLRRSATGKQDPSAAALQHIDDFILDRASLSLSIDDAVQTLTVPELRLLTLLTQNTGTVVERDVLSSAIFGHRPYPSDRSRDMLVSRLRKKIGPRKDGGERIKAVRGEGYMYLSAGEKK